LRCLSLQLAGVEIHYLTKKSFSSLLIHNPYINKLHIIEKNVAEVMAELKKENFDFIIDLHNNLRSAEVKLKLRCKSYSLQKLNFKKWLLVNFKINKMPALHIVDRYMHTVQALGVLNDHKGLDFFIPVNEEFDFIQLPISHQNGYTAFVIGAKHFTKQLPTDKIIAICKKINQPIILIGGNEDVNKASEIANAVGTLCLNFCGKYSLLQSASIIKNSKRVITHDTGMMHIAAAFNKIIYSVWGNTVPEFGFAPYMPASNSKMIEVKNLSCRPCSKIGYNACPKKHFKCMKEIEIEAFVG
jgi:ADP-heptose:LPS heptosyltransferase